MKIKNICKTSILILILFLSGCDDVLIQQKLKDSSNNNQSEKKSKSYNMVSDEVKLEVINFLVLEIKVNSGNLCVKNEKIYFSKNSLSAYVLENFPKKINDCKTVLVDDNQYNSRNSSYDLHSFSRWSEENGKVYVTSKTEFAGGNQGGCDFSLIKENKNWRIDTTDCFAAAS